MATDILGLMFCHNTWKVGNIDTELFNGKKKKKRKRFHSRVYECQYYVIKMVNRSIQSFCFEPQNEKGGGFITFFYLNKSRAFHFGC